MQKILVVEDEKSMRDLLKTVLKREGYLVETIGDGQGAIRALKKEIFDLVIADVKMPGLDGLDVLKAVKEASPETVVIMITAFASPETAVTAMKEGAYDYITKPFNIDEMNHVIRNALEKQRLRKENLFLKREIRGLSHLTNIIGKSGKMLKVLELVQRVADGTSNILILGESGTGKELIARAIHFNSGRREAPFVTINCSALPEALLESELFGHMKGSFTGAIANKEGLFEVARGGTIFLDEIGEIPPTIQVKLLRVLQEKEFRRIGGTQDIRVDVRIIAATNKDLEKAVAEGAFREDLYYRVDVIPIHLPPLRERREDIPLLAEHFLSKLSRTAEKNIRGMTPEAIQMLQRHDWKGNVRELENVIERVVALTTHERIAPEDLQGCLQRPSSPGASFFIDLPSEGIHLDQYMGKIEKNLLSRALEKAGWAKKDAARLLHLDLRSFRYRLTKYGLSKNTE